jgi:hypothetical protein
MIMIIIFVFIWEDESGKGSGKREGREGHIHKKVFEGGVSKK